VRLLGPDSRRVMLEMVDRHQRRIAAHALVDGPAVLTGTMIGLSPRALGMRWARTWTPTCAPDWLA